MNAPSTIEIADDVDTAMAACIAAGMGLTGPHPLDDAAFNELALAVHAWQRTNVPPYQRWCDVIGADAPTSWETIPMLPIAAFKQFAVTSVADTAAAEWHSSGTTGSETSRHILPSTDLYDRSMLAPALAMLTPDVDRMPVVQLAAPGHLLPRSSLLHMFDAIRTRVDSDHAGISGTYENADGLQVQRAIAALQQAAHDDVAVLLLTTSFALVHLLDAIDEPIHLAAGSRVMDTGGYKGRSRELSRAELCDAVTRQINVPPSMFENEYGMSELSSQAWLGTIHRTVAGAGTLHDDESGGARWQPPWMRTRVLDPATLTEVADGDEGLLAHVDLANAYTCSFVRTEDWGRRIGTSYEVLGRAPGAALRGCSLRLEDVDLS